MDKMLMQWIENSPSSSLQELQNILKVLLPFTNSQDTTVCERALGRITRLANFLATTLLQEDFGKYLQPSHRTGIVLVAVEAMRDSNTYDETTARSMLDVAIKDPGFWLTDVPRIIRCVYQNMECISTTAHQRKSSQGSLDIVLLQLTNQRPGEVVRSLLALSPISDRVAMAMWQVVVSQMVTLQKVLRELLAVLGDQEQRRLFPCVRRHARVCRLPVSYQRRPDYEVLYHLQRLLKHPRPAMFPLVLTMLLTLSETPEMARRIGLKLPDIMEAMQHASSDTKMKTFLLTRNVMRHMKRKPKQASSVAVQLAGKLLPLFSDESSQVRELSIRLCKKMMETVVWCHKRKMRKIVQRGLLPFFLHMNDQAESVAKASAEALIVAAEFLQWKELKRLVKTGQTFRIGEYLLQRDPRTVEEKLQQSLMYLQDSQAAIREAAVRFIG
ncbi:MROH7 protein, partial [Alectura lathami]|nr:MROH7 protein [Alectura lathami]